VAAVAAASQGRAHSPGCCCQSVFLKLSMEPRQNAKVLGEARLAPLVSGVETMKRPSKSLVYGGDYTCCQKLRRAFVATTEIRQPQRLPVIMAIRN